MLGNGLIKGMATTARNFLGSYVQPDRLVTVQYPEERIAPLENARSFPFLVYDGEDPTAGLRCVACLICETECPPQCIYIVKSPAKTLNHLGKLQTHPQVFDIDLSVCMSCQICVEVCPFDAIKMDTEVELSTADRFGGLVQHKGQLAKPNSYYHKLHPTDAAASDSILAEGKARIEAKARAKAGSSAPAATAGPASPPPASAAV